MYGLGTRGVTEILGVCVMDWEHVGQGYWEYVYGLGTGSLKIFRTRGLGIMKWGKLFADMQMEDISIFSLDDRWWHAFQNAPHIDSLL